MQERTFHLTAQDGVGLAGSVWEVKKPRALILWIHGFAEHRRRYQHFAQWLAEKKFALAAIDLRGHGESEGKRGAVKKFEEYFRDLTVFLHWAQNNFPKTKYVLGAHSMGGLVAARYVEEGALPIKLEALAVTGPFLGLPKEVPGWQRDILSGAAKFLPNLAIPSGIDPALLSHNPDIVMSYKHDPLVFGKLRVRWLLEIVKHQRLVQSKAPAIKIPTLVMQGLEDQVVNPEASRLFYDGLETKKEWIGYEGGFHEILNETFREKVYGDMFAWLKKQV